MFVQNDETQREVYNYNNELACTDSFYVTLVLVCENCYLHTKCIEI